VPTLFLVLLFAIIFIALHSGVLYWVLRYANGVGSWLRAFSVSILQCATVLGLWVLMALQHEDGAGFVGLLLAFLAVEVLLLPFMLWNFRRRVWLGVKSWSFQCAGYFAVGLTMFAVASPCLGVTYNPNSPMSPNIRGYHNIEGLADGTHFIIPANTPGDPQGIPSGGNSSGIVAETFEQRAIPRPERHTFAADRFKRVRPDVGKRSFFPTAMNHRVEL
jgi:hypothetical protein